MYYKLKGKLPVPIADTLEWAIYFEQTRRTGKRIVKQQVVAHDVRVSTIFLSIDHGYAWLPQAVPVLFETMIFGGPMDSYQKRYTSWEAAEKGHEKAKQRLKGAFMVKRLKSLREES